MKTTTRIILVIGLVVIALASLAPPWNYTYDANGNSGGHSQQPAGHHTLFDPPRPSDDRVVFGTSVDFKGLFIEWTAISAAVAAALLITPLITRRLAIRSLAGVGILLVGTIVLSLIAARFRSKQDTQLGFVPNPQPNQNKGYDILEPEKRKVVIQEFPDKPSPATNAERFLLDTNTNPFDRFDTIPAK